MRIDIPNTSAVNICGGKQRTIRCYVFPSVCARLQTTN